jgi:predicted DCC family thiol-disulfide oxidoreductase YuxK
MSGTGASAASAQHYGGVSRPTFVYDGDCAFCSSCARFIERRVSTRAQVVPWQRSDLAALGLTEAQAEEAVQWVEPGRPTMAGPAAIAVLLLDAQWYWRILGALLRPKPVQWLAWPVYRWISRNRHRMPGGTPACSLPQAQRPPAD